jgi:hypothetical protein
MRMADTLEKFTLQTRLHDLTVAQIDQENYAIMVDGVYEAAFSGRAPAFDAVLRSLRRSAQLDVGALEQVADITNWHRTLVSNTDDEVGVGF